MKLFVAVAIFGAVLAASPASATHDMVYAPCDPEETRSLDEQVWYQDYQSQTALRYDDPWWAERPGLAGYTNWEHQCRLGQTGVWQAAPIPPLFIHRTTKWRLGNRNLHVSENSKRQLTA